MHKEDSQLVEGSEHFLRHAVVNRRFHLLRNFRRDPAIKIDVISDRAFNALDLRKAANVGDIRRLGTPRANRSWTGSHHKKSALRIPGFHRRTVSQDFFKGFLFFGGKFLFQIDDMDKFRIDSLDRKSVLLKIGKKFLNAEGRKGRRTTKNHHKNTLR